MAYKMTNFGRTTGKQEKYKPTTVIFLHIPKTAGTTLRGILGRQYSPDAIRSFGGVRDQASLTQFKALDSESKEQIRLISGHIPYGLHEYLPNPTVYFTILRNPLTRVISDFNHILRTPSHRLYDSVVGKNMNLHDFLESGLAKMSNDGQVRLISGEWFEPAYGEVTPAMLEVAKKNLAGSFIVTGLMEQFDKTLFLLKDNLDWQQSINYQRLNVSRQGVKNVDLPAATIDFLKHINCQDIALYAYVQELFNEQCAQMGALFNFRVHFFKFLNRFVPTAKKLRAQFKKL